MNSVRFVLAKILTMAACLVLLAGCASGTASGIPNPFAALFPGSKAEQALSAGVRQFEEGEYAKATQSLQSALDLGLAGDSDRIKAHKYLAFIHCVSGRQRTCRDEFGKALEINPSMELEPSERGHPIWGPQFRSAKIRK